MSRSDRHASPFDTSVQEVTSTGGDGPLTPREREVAALVAEGRTNRQIAETLVVVETTAERHVANILNKLGFHSRAQIAAWYERGVSTRSE